MGPNNQHSIPAYMFRNGQDNRGRAIGQVTRELPSTRERDAAFDYGYDSTMAIVWEDQLYDSPR